MKIAIYDKWLNTLGGGEKVATTIAEYLSKNGHEVFLISSFDVDKGELEEKMDADLSKVKLLAWYERRYEDLYPRTKKYDLFINTSFVDHLPSGAKKSIFYVHFPTPIKSSVLGLIKYGKTLPFLRKFLLIPEVYSGLSPIEDIYARGGKWLGNKNTIVLRNTPDKFDITLRIYAEKLKYSTPDMVNFTSPNARVEIKDRRIEHRSNVVTHKLSVVSKKRSVAIKININEDLKLNALGLVSMTVWNMRYFVWNLFKRLLPKYEMALYGSSDYHIAPGINKYDLFLVNSEYTKKWTKKYWGKDSKVLYPPVDVKKFKPGRKKNIILNVGRFFVGGHSKRQDVLVSSFKKLLKEAKLKGWELHLVGGVAAGRSHYEYLEKLKKSAENYPIFFHFFADFKELKKLYSQAKIYWHATGYEIDDRKHPVKMEHFGITPVEAMAAGAVPVVYGGGGITEVVDDESGFTWSTKNELIKKTQKLALDNKLRKKFSTKAIKRAKKFSKEEFSRKLLEEVKNL